MLLKLLKFTKIVIRKQIRRRISLVDNESFPEKNAPRNR